MVTKPCPAPRLSALALLAFCAAAACSDSQAVDKNYGTDAAAGYQGPDGGILSESRDALSDAQGDALDSGAGEVPNEGADEVEAAPPQTAGDNVMNAAAPTPNN